MDFLTRTGDFFGGFVPGVERALTKLFGSANDREVKRIGFVREKDGSSEVVSGSVIDRINSLEPEWEAKSESELAETASRFRTRIAAGETLDDLLPEAFAAVRESAKRTLQMRHYDVQMVGGYILHQGKIAEMVTGEGKTLVSTLPAFLNALTGSVHAITVNDYLALRDMEWMGPVHMNLGLTVGAIQANMGPQARRDAYACDITYGTNNEFGFDYLRDNMKPTPELQAQGPLNFALIDEIDNILIDEARTPLIISGPADDDVSKYPKANRIAMQLRPDVDFEVKEKEHSCHLTEEGVRHAEELVGVESFYTAGNMEWPHLLDNALKAHHLFKRDVTYVVERGEVIIVDEFTGRKMEGRQWSDGLHQAVQAKEGVKIKEENQTLATITLQNFFKLYDKLAGMTGTAMTEAGEFYKIYGLDVVAVPTNRPMARINYPDLVYITEKEKWDAVVDEVKEAHATGRPVLVGTASIENSELISRKLSKVGIQHDVLNAKHQEREADIVAQAGRKGAVTIATNMAGRGTDIILGGNPENRGWEILKQTYSSRLEVPKSEWDRVTKEVAQQEGMEEEGRVVADLGGLHVVGTERHDSRRIDLQLRGRAGRQGDPGSSRFFVSLDDTLMRLFAGDRIKKMMRALGMAEGEAIESRMVSRRIEAAQKKREETHFDQRKNLLEYDEVMDDQRKRVYDFRQQVLESIGVREKIDEMIDRLIDQELPQFYDRTYRWDALANWASAELRIRVTDRDIENMERDQLLEFLRTEAFYQGDSQIAEMIEENLPEDLEEREWNWQALSRWANTHFGINTSVSELKKVGREELRTYLAERAGAAINRFDLSGVDHFLDSDYPYRSLCAWAEYQFDLACTPEEFRDFDDAEAARVHLRQRIDDAYREKEIEFPVSVALSQFVKDNRNEADRREELAKYVNRRFETDFTPETFKGLNRESMSSRLEDASRSYFVNGDVTGQIDEYLDRAYDSRSGTVVDDPEAQEALNALSKWARDQFQIELDPGSFTEVDRETARRKVLDGYDSRYRREMAHAERSVLREILDTAWKDHLYYMDHLRSGIGLSSYAQKDPKVEYKREGRKAFDAMWDRIAKETIASLFRVEIDLGDEVHNAFQPTQEIHAAAEEPVAVGAMESASGSSPDAGVIEQIRTTEPKVGRNDPCPCGSGKKYKKCCGAG